MRLQTIRIALRDLATRAAASRSFRRWFRVVVGGAVLTWLVIQLSHIGWAEVWTARPRSPWFYIIWVCLYFQLPLAEVIIYRMIWRLPARDLAAPLLRKRALNQDVFSYSGEVYFFSWLRNRVGQPGRRILGALKDNAIASALASWVSTTLFVGGFILAGQVPFLDVLAREDLIVIGIVAVIVSVLLLVAIRLRRKILSIPTATAAKVFGIHVSRLVFITGLLQIVQWWIVLPEAPLSVWATMFVVLSVINRLPLIPARDLVGISAVLGLNAFIAAPASAIAAIMLVRSALDKTANGAFFVAGHFMARRKQPVGDELPAGVPISVEVSTPIRAVSPEKA